MIQTCNGSTYGNLFPIHRFQITSEVCVYVFTAFVFPFHFVTLRTVSGFQAFLRRQKVICRKFLWADPEVAP